jgi:large subunit ribosomal protein L53
MPLRHLKRIRVQFNPFDSRTTAAREFLARVTSPRAKASNPECAVEPRVRNDDAPPVVFVEFTNGAKDQFNVHRMTVKQINDRIDTVSKQLETKQSLKDAGLKFEDLKFNVKGT